jgi:hypothetical protein
MTRFAPVFRCLAFAGWVLVMPPVPLRTSLPPLSDWSALSAHRTGEECENKRQSMRESARRTVSGDPNAQAVKIAAALGQLQARCIEREGVPPEARQEAGTQPAEGGEAARPVTGAEPAPARVGPAPASNDPAAARNEARR